MNAKTIALITSFLIVVMYNNCSAQNVHPNCYVSGVPTPTYEGGYIFGKEWVNLGILRDAALFKEKAGGVPLQSELWYWEPVEIGPLPLPNGYCLAMTRTIDGSVGHVDMICVSLTSPPSVCFFESDPPVDHTIEVHQSSAPFNFPLDGTGQFNDLNDVRDIDISGCLSCHAGENPFVVYPDDPVFRRAALHKQHDWGGDESLMTPDWYVGTQGLRQEALPNNNLTTPAGQKYCTTCHQQGIAGRFPRLDSSFPQKQTYCNNVLLPALGYSANIPNKDFSATMPQGDHYNLADYRGQINQLLASCDPVSWNVVQPGWLDFGDVRPGNTVQATDYFQVLTLGNIEKTITSLRVVGPDASTFSINHGLLGSLPQSRQSGEAFRIDVTFSVPPDADAPRLYRAELVVSSDDGEVNRVKLEANVVSPVISILPETIPFGRVTVGEGFLRRVLVTNIGTDDLTWQITSIDQSQFKWPRDFYNVQTLRPGENSIIDVRFEPSSVGNHELDLDLTSNDEDVSIRLFGRGEPTPPTPLPEIDVSYAHTILSFGGTVVGERKSEDLTITNTGQAPLSVSRLIVTGSSAFEQPRTVLPLTIDPGERRRVTLFYKPFNADNHEGVIHIHSNAPDSLVQVDLFGRVAYPRVYITPPDINFGRLGSNDQQSRTIKVYNLGSAEMVTNVRIVNERGILGNASADFFKISRARIYGQTANPVTVPVAPDGKSLVVPTESGIPSSIPNGGNLLLEITFSPRGALGQMDATLEVFTNDLDTPMQTVSLQGTSFPMILLPPDVSLPRIP